jgi:hypothetical protein
MKNKKICVSKVRLTTYLKNSRNIPIFGFIAAFLAVSALNAQASRFDAVIDGFLQSGFYGPNASSDPYVETQQLVNLDRIALEEAVLTGSYSELNLLSSEYLMQITNTAQGSPGVVTYLGSVFDTEFHDVGSIKITSGNGLFYGIISTNEGTYQIQPTDEDSLAPYLLQKMKQTPAEGITDFDSPADEGLAMFPSDEMSLESPIAEQASLSQSTIVDVLVLYTPSVRAGKGGTTATDNWVNTIIADYNSKLTELGISSFSLSLKASLETKWPTFPANYHENDTHNGTNACFVQNGLTFCDSLIADQYWVSTNSTVASLRNTYTADLVVLITADSQKHPNDLVHGFAGLKNNSGATPSTHGGSLGGGQSGTWGEFTTVRDTFALANLTFHHEVGHAFGAAHSHGAWTFGYIYSSGQWIQTTGPSGHLKPQTIMQAQSPICLWSDNSSSNSCHMRLPFFAHATKNRQVFYSGFFVPRVFDPYKGALFGRLELGAYIVSQQK